jgi:hypothetical protein
MKEHLIPYMVQNSNQWCGLNITNSSQVATTVFIEYFLSNGGKFAAKEVPLNAGCETQFNTTVSYGWARVISDNFVNIVGFIGDVGKSTAVIPIEKRDLVIKNVVPRSMTISQITNTEFTWDICNCKYFHKQFITALEYIARALNYKYPTRVAKKLEMMDGSTPDGTDCPGHPGGSHSFGDAVDIHYFTMGATNHTQQKPAGDLEKLIQIWTPNPPIESTATLNEMFDAQRNVDFVLLMNKVFPRNSDACLMMVDDRIKQLLATTAKIMYGDSAWKIIMAVLQGDGPMVYNHHTHYHCNYQNTINWDAVL